MKFIKEDGTIEDGTPVSENTLALRGHLQAYLHTVVCKGGYHSSYDEKMPPCAVAATFLAVTVNNNQDEPADYSFAVEKEVLRLTRPEPEPEAPEPVVTEQPPSGSVAAIAAGSATA